MSDMKSIWRSKNEMPQANKDVVEHWINCYDEHCYSMWKQRPDSGSFDSHTIAWCYLDDLLALETELTKCKKQVKKLRKQNRTLTESLGEYFNKWIDANIQAIKDKDQIRVLTEQEQARHQLIIDQLKGLK